MSQKRAREFSDSSEEESLISSRSAGSRRRH